MMQPSRAMPLVHAADRGSMTAATAMTARAVVEIFLLRHSAQLEGFRDVLVDRFLHLLHRLLGVEETLGHRAAQKCFAPLFKFRDFRHVEWRARLLFVLQHRAAVAQLLVL